MLISFPWGRRGSEGEQTASHANYLNDRLKGVYHLPYDRPACNECVFNRSIPGKASCDHPSDIAKRLIRLRISSSHHLFSAGGQGCLMMEPTETRAGKVSTDLSTRDRDCAEARTVPIFSGRAPQRVKVRRLDDVLAARRTKLKWKGKE